MKKSILLTPLLLALIPTASAQCEPVALPYQVNAEAAAPPALPECVTSNYNSFVSTEEFETIAGPVPGFNGNVLGYNTVVDTQWGADPSSPVSASLYTRSFMLQQGAYYSISYRYGNSDPAKTISSVYVSIVSGGINSTEIVNHENITGATPVNYASQPFTVASTGQYMLVFYVATTGTQGFFYLDDILVKQEQGAIGATDKQELSLVSAYPNPAKDVVTLTGSRPITKIELFTTTGQKVLSKTGDGTTNSIDVQALSAGIYILAAEAESLRQTIKIIKE